MPIHRPRVDLIFADKHAVLVGDWKLIFDRGSNVWALFNLRRDPKEELNLVDTHRDWVDILTKRLILYLSGSPPLEL